MSRAPGRRCAQPRVAVQTGRHGMPALSARPAAASATASSCRSTVTARARALPRLHPGRPRVPAGEHGHRPAELAHLIADGRPRIFVGRADPAEAIHLLDDSVSPPAVLGLDQNGVGTLEDLAAATGEAPAVVARRADDIASGPLHVGDHRSAEGRDAEPPRDDVVRARAGRAWRFGTSRVLLHALPLFHGHGLFVSSNVALAAGARLQLLPRFDIGEVIDALPTGDGLHGRPDLLPPPARR